jgi:sterol desaturase/sphingolipid hydroxylase (fatty acid hydroxylase superfamily)
MQTRQFRAQAPQLELDFGLSWRGLHRLHRIDHQLGLHRNNYGDIVWWDMLFGTYENPKEWNDRCGFEHDKEQLLLPMLAFRDVHRID